MTTEEKIRELLPREAACDEHETFDTHPIDKAVAKLLQIVKGSVQLRDAQWIKRCQKEVREARIDEAKLFHSKITEDSPFNMGAETQGYKENKRLFAVDRIKQLKEAGRP